jgi:catechol 2,3-dioxygenase-like lactoylglutathione lyase family enzyme
MIDAKRESFAQLVAEISVRDLDRSLALYTALGFSVDRRTGGFAVLIWDDAMVFLDEYPNLSETSGAPRANLRVIVEDVDDMWATARKLGLVVNREIADRSYGLRDFTVLDYDGFGLRFATPLENGEAKTEFDL